MAAVTITLRYFRFCYQILSVELRNGKPYEIKMQNTELWRIKFYSAYLHNNVIFHQLQFFVFGNYEPLSSVLSLTQQSKRKRKLKKREREKRQKISWVSSGLSYIINMILRLFNKIDTIANHRAVREKGNQNT